MKDVTVLDTETTGFDPEDNSVVEIAAVSLETGEWHQSLVKPRHPISFGAMSTHLITERMVENAEYLEDLSLPGLYTNASVMAAHYAEFDRSFLNMEGIEFDTAWICTYRCSLHLMPRVESHRNIALCLEAGLDIFDSPSVPGDSNASMPHRALFDSWATRRLLQHLIELASNSDNFSNSGFSDVIDYLVWLTTEPALLSKVSFGEHKGKYWEDVPPGYLRWILGKDFDEDTKYTARHYLR